MQNMKVTIRASVTKNVELSSEQVEKILADYARKEFNFQNPQVTLDAGRDFLRGATITSTETQEHVENQAHE